MTEAFVVWMSIQSDFGRVFEHFSNAFARLRWTFEIVARANTFRAEKSVFRADDLLVLRFDSLVNQRIVAQIAFVSNEKNRHVVTVVFHFGCPLVQHARQTVGRIEGETDQNHLRVRIAENTKSENRKRERGWRRRKGGNSRLTWRILLVQLCQWEVIQSVCYRHR